MAFIHFLSLRAARRGHFATGDAGGARWQAGQARTVADGTRHLHTLEFPAGSGNQTAHVIARWITARGKTGPVSNIASCSVAA